MAASDASIVPAEVGQRVGLQVEGAHADGAHIGASTPTYHTAHRPQQNGMIKRVIRTLNEQCVHRHRLETHQHASRVIGEWIRFYNTRWPHQALGMNNPAVAYTLVV